MAELTGDPITAAAATLTYPPVNAPLSVNIPSYGFSWYMFTVSCAVPKGMVGNGRRLQGSFSVPFDWCLF